MAELTSELTKEDLDGLREMLLRPHNYIYRRLETVVVARVNHFVWEHRIDISPPPGSGLVSLGVFPKRRLPDLEAEIGGETVPLLPRHQQTAVISHMLLVPFLNRWWPRMSTVCRRNLLGEISSIVSSDPDSATRRFEIYERLLKLLPPPHRPQKSADFDKAFSDHLTGVGSFTRHTLLLAHISKSENLRVRLRYTDEANYPTLRTVWAGIVNHRENLNNYLGRRAYLRG